MKNFTISYQINFTYEDPNENISRLIDILPGLFVVLGIFGTFIGISMALPKIAQMDFNNLEGSGAILTEFVLNVSDDCTYCDSLRAMLSRE